MFLITLRKKVSIAANRKREPGAESRKVVGCLARILERNLFKTTSTRVVLGKQEWFRQEAKIESVGKLAVVWKRYAS